ncbi:hypothetical protein AAUPMC_05232, partial [Pasteurella multocida subsp. multocida str. Anand1_cattle]
TFRREFKLGWNDLVEGLEAGARNMMESGSLLQRQGLLLG